MYRGTMIKIQEWKPKAEFKFGELRDVVHGSIDPDVSDQIYDEIKCLNHYRVWPTLVILYEHNRKEWLN